MAQSHWSIYSLGQDLSYYNISTLIVQYSKTNLLDFTNVKHLFLAVLVIPVKTVPRVVGQTVFLPAGGVGLARVPETHLKPGTVHFIAEIITVDRMI